MNKTTKRENDRTAEKMFVCVCVFCFVLFRLFFLPKDVPYNLT